MEIADFAIRGIVCYRSYRSCWSTRRCTGFLTTGCMRRSWTSPVSSVGNESEQSASTAVQRPGRHGRAEPGTWRTVAAAESRCHRSRLGSGRADLPPASGYLAGYLGSSERFALKRRDPRRSARLHGGPNLQTAPGTHHQGFHQVVGVPVGGALPRSVRAMSVKPAISSGNET